MDTAEEYEVDLENDPTVVRACPEEVRRSRTPLPTDPVQDERKAITADWKQTLMTEYQMPKPLVDDMELAVALRTFRRLRP